ncbi:MAG TPA: 3-phosphoshikimate 1-carboxyvinyltransferase, partial [Ktedonobacter sp.]|nr:3-phosphoshikimate 1-carboxyvinyltransferase [Ktedonobacter sp.]
MKERIEGQLFIAPTALLRGEPLVPSSKYYTLRYVLAATLTNGESRIHFPAESDDSDALFRGCRALGATLAWEDAHTLLIRGVGRPYAKEPVTINVGNAGAVARLLMGISATLPDVTFVTDHPQSLGKRPNRELLEALTTLGVICESEHIEGYLPVTLHGEHIHGGHVTISGARSSQYISALLFLAPLLNEGLKITVVDDMKSQSLLSASLEVLQEAGIVIEHDDTLRHFSIADGQRYLPRNYTIPG